MSKINVAVLFGGKSAEHEVSIMSAKNIIDAIDKDKFNLLLIGIAKNGQWCLQQPGNNQLQINSKSNNLLSITPGSNELTCADGHKHKIDVAMPILHGPFGEDGTVQGLFELLDVPYVGPGVLSSALCMDKEVMKRLLQNASIATAAYLSFRIHQKNDILPGDIFKKLGQTVFVKPANMGSSVGIKKAHNATELDVAINEAFKHDTKIIIESAIEGQEIECSILGNANPQTSEIGQIIPREGDFYSYEAKYLDENGAILQIPAKISPQVAKKARDIALKTYQVMECEGMSRVDMFVANDGDILVNEINTIPGFTKISMYPKLWQASGVSYSDLITMLIEFAIEKYNKSNLSSCI
ncbi:MAG: D-alanine--D-alanine ligase family protein [Candidatus Woesebacteria bacterium]